jgi:hypothetical protein
VNLLESAGGLTAGSTLAARTMVTLTVGLTVGYMMVDCQSVIFLFLRFIAAFCLFVSRCTKIILGE